MMTEYGTKTPGVFVINVQEYLQNFWPDLTNAYELYLSLKAALHEAKGKSKYLLFKSDML